MAAEIDLSKITVRALEKPAEIELGRTALSRGHYLGDCKAQYRRLYQVAESDGEWIAVLLWDQCVIRNRVRDEWIGWSTEARGIHCTEVLNNKRFCIAPEYTGVQNLGSRILGLAVQDLKSSWLGRYGEEVLLCETFVDPERYAGTSYLAAGWEDIGLSAGYETRDKKTGKRVKTHPKKVFVKSLREDSKQRLCVPYRYIAEGLEQNNLHSGRMATVDLTKLDLKRLRERLVAIPDKRRAQGKKFSCATLIMMIALAVCAGCTGYQAIWEWLNHLPLPFRISLGLRLGIVPSEPTIRRFVQNIDIVALKQAVYGWLREQTQGLPGQQVISLDGKALRGTRTATSPAKEVLGAVLAPIGIPIAQEPVSEKTNEIPVAQSLLPELPIEGKVIVADAIHTQVKTAEIIKKSRLSVSCQTKSRQSPRINL